MTSNTTWYVFLGLTAIVGVLVAIIAFAVFRFVAAARDARRQLSGHPEGALLSSALEEAIAKLRAQERATAARAEASERLSEQIVASLTSGLVVVDHDERVQIVNPAARRILELGDVKGQSHYRELFANAAPLADVIAESLRTRSAVVRRTITLESGNGPKHLGVTVSPLGAGTAAAGAICLFSDLTAVVALEEQLRFKEALARLGELTAGLAHEFRNGLATIHGYSRLLDPNALPEQYRPYVEGLRSETHALEEVVTNFLKFAKPNPLTLASLDLRAVIERAADDTPHARVEVHGDFGTVEADEVLLRQAFSNLFRNSVEACAAASIAPNITVDATYDAASETVQIDVRDNGPGIAAESLPRVFDPFFTTRPGGTGLGLAIVQKIVVSHNGRISAGNRPEGGALFRVALPLHMVATSVSRDAGT